LKTFHSQCDRSLPTIITLVCTAAFWLVMQKGVAQPADSPSPVKAVECRPRGGLPNFFAKAKAGVFDDEEDINRRAKDM
jgi:hypothetical protein